MDYTQLIEIYPHNKETLYHEPIFLPTPATRLLDKSSLEKLRGFQNAVLFTLWKVQVRMSVVEAFVVATPSLPKLVSVATTLKEMKALFATYTPPPADKIDVYEAQVRAVRQAMEQRATRAVSQAFSSTSSSSSDDLMSSASSPASSAVASPVVPHSSNLTTAAQSRAASGVSAISASSPFASASSSAVSSPSVPRASNASHVVASPATSHRAPLEKSPSAGSTLTPLLPSVPKARDDRSLMLAAIDAAAAGVYVVGVCDVELFSHRH
jgi:hypothetical protein